MKITDTENAGRRLARPMARLLSCAALLIAFAAQVGCEVDSYIDQSVVGRWEYTPTVVPILEKIDVIEADQGEFIETTPILPEDLVPQVSDYRVGSGDALFIEIFDFLQPGVATPFERIVDARGEIDLPQLGGIPVLDLSASQIRQRIREALRDGGIIEDALVSVQIIERRQATYAIFGQVAGVGRYVIPEPNYRLLEAITEAGGIAPGTRHIYIIRQAPLVDATGAGSPAEPPAIDDQGGIDLDSLIEDLQSDENGGFAVLQQDAGAQPPPVDLIDETAGAPGLEDREDGSWVFIDGRWVRVGPAQAGGIPEGADPLAGDTGGALVSQRVIEVPVEPLIQGDARYNIVIRPGDVIRVPGADQGFIYLAGVGVARPGVYALPTIGRLTLTKAVMSAGGLTGIAVPKRVDLIRMIGDDRQATIRLNLKAIAEGTHPDVFLRSDDMINVGTNFWAQPVAVIRNGFRATYGFGFLLDRNFGNDVFGPPPTDRGF